MEVRSFEITQQTSDVLELREISSHNRLNAVWRVAIIMIVAILLVGVSGLTTTPASDERCEVIEAERFTGRVWCVEAAAGHDTLTLTGFPWVVVLLGAVALIGAAALGIDLRGFGMSYAGDSARRLHIDRRKREVHIDKRSGASSHFRFDVVNFEPDHDDTTGQTRRMTFYNKGDATYSLAIPMQQTAIYEGVRAFLDENTSK